MSKFSFKAINLDWQASQKDDNALTNFLNDELTGEIIHIHCKAVNSSSSDLTYYIIYKKIEPNSLKEEEENYEKNFESNDEKPELL